MTSSSSCVPTSPNASLADDLADRLIEAVSEPIDLGIERRVVTASVGVVLVAPHRSNPTKC